MASPALYYEVDDRCKYETDHNRSGQNSQNSKGQQDDTANQIQRVFECSHHSLLKSLLVYTRCQVTPAPCPTAVTATTLRGRVFVALSVALKQQSVPHPTRIDPT